MVERGGPLALARQCGLLGVSRSSQYYEPLGESAENLALMRRLDELHLAHPFYGSRQMARHLCREGTVVGRHRVRRLMRLMGMEAIYRKPRTRVANPEHRVYPYLLRDLVIDRPDQVWCADITYLPVSQGFFYLVAVMDWASRRVLMLRLGREVPELPAELLFSDLELRVLASFARSRKLPIPEHLGAAVPLAARLGGWTGRTRPPGAQLLWQGLTRLVTMTFAVELHEEYG